jgi:archaemetzincin
VKFKIPNSAERTAALGDVAGLPKALRCALEPGQDFEPLPAPGPNDWLANHPEPGQTFDQYVRSRPNRPDQRRRKIYLQPIGDFDRPGVPSLHHLASFTSAFFMLETETLSSIDLSRASVRTRRNPGGGHIQLLTADILDLLRTRLPRDAFAIIGITMLDLYPDPAWNFVFGQASFRDRVGVCSFARYDPKFYGEASAADAHNLVLRRSCKVLAHETAHMFGMEHCIWYRCLLNGSNHLAESDERPLHLCPVDLRKLQWNIGFDIVERYRRLLRFYTESGFDDEARWVERRIRFIECMPRARRSRRPVGPNSR